MFTVLILNLHLPLFQIFVIFWVQHIKSVFLFRRNDLCLISKILLSLEFLSLKAILGNKNRSSVKLANMRNLLLIWRLFGAEHSLVRRVYLTWQLEVRMSNFFFMGFDCRTRTSQRRPSKHWLSLLFHIKFLSLRFRIRNRFIFYSTLLTVQLATQKGSWSASVIKQGIIRLRTQKLFNCFGGGAGLDIFG